MTDELTHTTPDEPSSDEGFASMATPSELAPAPRTVERDIAVPPRLERDRPARRPLVPVWAWITVASFFGFTLVAAVIWILAFMPKSVVVPDVTGIDQTTAATRLKQVGLETAITDERFSPLPKGEVLEQNPAPGEEVREGDVVSIVISAGTEDFAMPDVVGNGVSVAKAALEELGLVVEIQSVTSDAASDTVLATVPSAGTSVRSGDSVQMQVATPRPQLSGVRPYDLTGVSIMIDPASVPSGRSDVPVEVARRLRALFEASGADVVMTRSGVSTPTSVDERRRMASESTSTVGIGLSADEKPTPGRNVISNPSAVSSPFVTGMLSALTTAAPPVSAVAIDNDEVFATVTFTWARVRLGSFAQRDDETAFANPRWSDDVARAIYSAVGEVYGKKDGM